MSTVVRKQIRIIADIQIGTVSGGKVGGGGETIAGKSTVTNASVVMKKDLKAAKKFALVIGLFALSWIPLETMNTISLLGGPVYFEFVLAAVWLSHLNSAVNPFLYAYGNKAIKGAMRALLLCQSNHVQPDTSIVSVTAA